MLRLQIQEGRGGEAAGPVRKSLMLVFLHRARSLGKLALQENGPQKTAAHPSQKWANLPKL